MEGSDKLGNIRFSDTGGVNMLVTKRVTINNKYYMHNYSDAGFYIERDGVLYEDAIDPLNTDRVYTETETEIPKQEEEENEDIY